MTTSSGSDRQQEWTLVVRRSFAIPDLVPDDDARAALIECIEVQLHESGWRNAKRAVAEPMVDALLALGAEDTDDLAGLGGLSVSDATFVSQAAHRLIEKGMSVVDPEHLAFDVMSEHPPEVVAAAQRVLDRIRQYVSEQPLES